MAKFHVNPNTGNPGRCRAEKTCPFGDIVSDHYISEDEAREAYEKKNESSPQSLQKKFYRDYSQEESMEIARTIKKQVHPATYMSLGAHNFIATNGGLRFDARILPFNQDGTRSGRPANMTVEVKLNRLDYYDIKVYHLKKFDVHYHCQEENVDAFSLNNLLFSLDYNGQETLNPRI